MRFEHSELLWLVLVLPGVTMAFLWWTGRTRRRLLTQFIQARLLPELTVPESPQRSQGRALLWAGATALLGLALARPQWGSSWEEARQKGLDIVVAIDTSKSMLAEDIRPNRLARAKLAALDLMSLAQADRLGLIAFAGGAFLQCPLTLDDGVFKQCVDDLNVNIIPQGGTAIAEAIRTATQALSDEQNFQVLVLFTDGEDHDADAVVAAREAAEAGLRIYTVGLGTPEGELLRITDAQGKTDFVRDREGQVVKSRLNETLLQEIATTAQGFYLPLRGADTMEILYEKGLAPLPKSESEARLYRHYHERYHWPLGLALVLIIAEILWPRRSRSWATQHSAGARPADQTRAIATGVMSLVLLLPTVMLASPSSAHREFESGDYVEALREFDRLREKDPADARLHFNAGASAYRAGQFEEALERFNAAIAAPELQLQQQAYYNRGNAHYRVGEEQQDVPAKRKAWEQAVTDYEAALKLNEADEAARFNLEFVKRRIQELEQQQQQQQQQDQNKQNQDEKSEDNRDQQNQQSQQGDQQQDQGKDQQENQQQQSQQQDQQNQQDQQQQQANQQQQQQGEQDKQEPQKQSEPEQQSQQAQGQEQEKPREEPQSDQAAQPVEPGTMTPEQARRILDALKGDEQMLPLQLMSPQPRQPPAKDW